MKRKKRRWIIGGAAVLAVFLLLLIPPADPEPGLGPAPPDGGSAPVQPGDGGGPASADGEGKNELGALIQARMGLYEASYPEGLAQVQLLPLPDGSGLMLYTLMEPREENRIAGAVFAAALSDLSDDGAHFTVNDKFGHSFEHMEGALRFEEDRLHLSFDRLDNYGYEIPVKLQHEFVKIDAPDVRDARARMPFFSLDAALYGSPFSHTLNEDQIAKLGEELSREPFALYANEWWAHVQYDGVRVTGYPDENGGFTTVSGYAVTKPGIETVRGLMVGDSMERVLSAFPILLEQPHLIENYYPDSVLSALYGYVRHMENHGYILYRDDRPSEICYITEETAVIFTLDQEGIVTEIAYHF